MWKIQFLLNYSLIFCVYICGSHRLQRIKTVYEQITENAQYANFSDLIRANPEAKPTLIYSDVTVFVPENEAFNKYHDLFHSSLAFYHTVYGVHKINDLWNRKSLETVNEGNPPLWITRSANDLYVNNAKILQKHSNRVGASNTGREQVLHVIDELLDPLTTSQTNATAFNFLTKANSWKIGPHTVSNYLHKVHEHKLQHIFQQEGKNTFLVPVDSGIDNYKLSSINKYTILGHILPNRILFTRAAKRNSIYETMAGGDYINVVVMIIEKSAKVYMKSYTVLGDSNNKKGEYVAEIVRANIPVQNGVVHLISEPLGISERKLVPFPYLPLFNKISGDPELDITYKMGEMSGFNKLLQGSSHNFTFFVVYDNNWKKLLNDMELTEEFYKILQRQLIISDTPYSIEKLLSLNRANNYSDFALNSVSELLVLSVLEMDGDYFVKWQNKYIKVMRPNYECTNGIIHVLEAPLTHLRRKSEENHLIESYIKVLKHLALIKLF